MIEELFKQALSLHQGGQLQAARELYERLEKVLASNADILHLHGTVLFQLGKAAAGRTKILKALTLRPDASGFYDHLGSATRALGDLENALKHFEKAQIVSPLSDTAGFNAAIVCMESGRSERAIPILVRALIARPDNAALWQQLGIGLRDKGRLTEANAILRKAAIEAPLQIDTYFHLSEIQTALEQSASARNTAKRGILIAPNRHEFYANFRSDTPSSGSNWQSTTPRRYATILRPDQAKTWDQLAASCYAEIDYEGAFTAALRATLLAPAAPLPYNSVGTSLHHLGRYDAAAQASGRAVLIDPTFSDAEYNICQSAFCLGRPDLAWRHWPSRLQMTKSPKRVGLPAIWNGKTGKPEHLLVASEQGVGDDLLFLSCLPDLLEHADRITVETDPRLHGMLARTFPEIGLIGKQIGYGLGGAPTHDYSEATCKYGFTHLVFSGDLPAIFRSALRPSDARRRYLHPEETARHKWKAWLRKIAETGRPTLGLCWRSGTLMTAQRRTGYLTLEEMVSEIPTDAFTLINLQYGDATKELEDLASSAGIKVHNPPDLDQIRDLDRVLALMTCLDLIATPATTVQALAGASGTPTIGLDKSNFACSDGWDPMFSSLYPIKHPAEPTIIKGKAARFGAALRHFLEHGKLPITPV